MLILEQSNPSDTKIRDCMRLKSQVLHLSLTVKRICCYGYAKLLRDAESDPGRMSYLSGLV